MCLLIGLDGLDLASLRAGGYLHPCAVRRNLNYLNYSFTLGLDSDLHMGYALSKLCGQLIVGIVWISRARRAGGKHILALRAEKIVRAVRRDKKSKLSIPLLPNLVGIVRSTGTYTI